MKALFLSLATLFAATPLLAQEQPSGSARASGSDENEATASGTTRFLITGWAFGGFESPQGQDSTFSAGVSPILLWTLSDRVFFESEVEIGLESGETTVSLEYAHLAYFLNDTTTLGAGFFLTPFGSFRERLHPAWINKLPDMPLALDEEEGIAPTSSLGFQVRGAVPAGVAAFNYAVYVSNGPALKTEGEQAGMLDFGNLRDSNKGKAVGGRVGFLPVPALEVGYSFLVGKVGASDTEFRNLDALLQAVDLNYVATIRPLKGRIDARAEWVWSRVDDAAFGPFRFHNRRSGGYIQLAYRPSQVGPKPLRNLEGVVRYDALLLPKGAPLSTDQKRWTAGLNYWLGPSTIVKVAYERLRTRDRGTGETSRTHAFLLQSAIGF
ncbi:MAG TPA: hypothetical protein VGL03_05570 [Thermoanaerobaculia bacterium]